MNECYSNKYEFFSLRISDFSIIHVFKVYILLTVKLSCLLIFRCRNQTCIGISRTDFFSIRFNSFVSRMRMVFLTLYRINSDVSSRLATSISVHIIHEEEQWGSMANVSVFLLGAPLEYLNLYLSYQLDPSDLMRSTTFNSFSCYCRRWSFLTTEGLPYYHTN